MKRVFEILLIGAVLALAGGLFWPRTPRELPVVANAVGVMLPASETTDDRVVPVPAEPEQIARLFGWRPLSVAAPTADTPPSEPTIEPEPIRWLVHVGHVVDAADRVLYLFKDTRTDTALSLVQGEERRGWTLVDVGRNVFVAEHEGRKYVIDRKD